jgi:hypothetical protein
MNRLTLSKTLGISFVLHALVCLLFVFSFGKGFLRPVSPSLSWWGRVYVELPSVPAVPLSVSESRRNPAAVPSSALPLPLREAVFELPPISVKPLSTLSPAGQRSVQMPLSAPIAAFPERKEPVILFHPLLPYQFELYFKDRQVAHIELFFQVKKNANRNAVQVKRKISSGNLEADLLSARYISHYLYIQQQRFEPNAWQTVKIDLSTGP